MRNMSSPTITYIKLNAPAEGYVFWCRVHHRIATHMNEYNLHLCCDPSLGGIMMPCDVCITSKLNAARIYAQRAKEFLSEPCGYRWESTTEPKPGAAMLS